MEELPSPTLRDGSGEEEPVSISGEERRFVLRRQETAAWISLRVVWLIYWFWIRASCRLFITYLSVQPALALIFVFLRRTKEQEV